MHKAILKKGYSLLELSIVIGIIGFIIGNLLSLAKDKTEAEKITETYEKMDFIEKSISYYFAEYGSIPCPADPTIAENSANFGFATRNSSTSYKCDFHFQNNPASGAPYYNASYPNIAIGAIPTATLKISDDYSYDAWGRKFTYSMIQPCNTSNIQYLNNYNYGGTDSTNGILNPNYNSTQNFSNTSYCGSGNYAIQIQNSKNTTISSNAIYVLLSHGQNGHGAYNNKGSQIFRNISSTTGTCQLNQTRVGVNESTNALNDPGNASYCSTTQLLTSGVYIQQPLSFDNTQPSGNTAYLNYFDDIVHYRTKDQLIKEAKGMNKAGIYSSSLCNMAVNVTSLQNAALYCPFSKNNPTSNPTDCQKYLYYLSAQINALCF